jgi:hypothetical protein
MRKFVHAASAFSLVAAMAVAVPPGPGSRTIQETPGTTYTGTQPYQHSSANFTNILSTDFEAADGWDLNESVCGDQFAFGTICTYPTPASNPCLFKNHVANFNCCPADAHNPLLGDPNPDTGWSMSPSSRHCRQPSIVDVAPFAGTQHMRFEYDPLGGNPAGCTGFGGACRTRAITAQPTQADIPRTVWSFEINWSATLGSSIIQVMGQDTSVGSVFFVGYVYWYYLGYLFVYDFINAGFAFGGYWSNYLGTYQNFTADINPCDDTITYSYAGQVVLSTNMGFNPPYGDAAADIIAPVLDSTFYTTDHFPGSITDFDSHFVTYTPCTDACCDGVTGTCTDGADANSCAGPSNHYYPNVQCSQLGSDPKYPPTCDRDTGACCDTSPGAGCPGPEGVCTDGVLPEDCQGAQRTWTKNAACAAVPGTCNVGAGSCDAAGFCNYGHGKIGAPCVAASDCDVPGFCSAGKVGDLCSTDADCNILAATCEEATGSCCNTLAGTCEDDVLQADCSGAQRVWTKLGSCSAVDCDAVLGSCCDTDPFGGCTDTTSAGCTCSTCVWTKLGSCATTACTHSSIPTVSEWGLVVLTLLMLTGAKVYFGRREAVA